tara:strand:- start:177 stop:1544 length:1368 start_codon:yes stop_codon:yes gene_type:complete
MSSKRKLFGTDGIRGKANVYPMTGDIAFVLGRAVTAYFQKFNRRNKQPLIIVGKDTRRSCYMLEQAFSAGVCAQGGEVVLTGPLPTPGVAFVTQSMRGDAGVMISASHNAFDDNGIKIFDAHGFKLPDEVEAELENLIENPHLLETKLGAQLGRAKRLEEVFGRYLVHTKSVFSPQFDLEGLRIVLDCANGAGYKIAPMMFRELGAEVIALGIDPNGQNINFECGALHPDRAASAVVKYRADIGICLDGDADRLVVIDEKGQVVDGDKVIGLFARHLKDSGLLKNNDKVVGTVMSNLGLEKFVKQLGLDFIRTKVGDRYIIEELRAHSAILGGEPSGHIIFQNLATTGDGALAGLKFIEAMKFYNKTASELVSDIPLFPQVLRNCKVKNKPEFNSVPAIVSALKKAETDLGDKGRILLRYSGTESLARVMVEGQDQKQINGVCDELVTIVGKELN